MTAAWPIVADRDLGDVPALTAGFRPFNPDHLPVRRDPALESEKTTEQLLAEVRRVRPNLAKLAALTADTDEFIAELRATVADVEQVTGKTIRRAA